MPVLYVAFRLRRPRSPWRFPTCKLSLVRCSGTSVQPTGRPRRDTHTGHMIKVWWWPRSVRRRSWPWHRNPIYQSLNSRHGPWSCRELGNPPPCCQVPAERDMCAYGCICVAAVATPRPLFMTSWCLRATGRRFRPRPEECLSAALISHCVLTSIFSCLSSTWPSSPWRLCFSYGHSVEHIVDVPAPQLQEDMFAGPARSTRTYFHAHCRANHEQIIENINQSYLSGAHAAMHSGADRVHARSTVHGSNR